MSDSNNNNNRQETTKVTLDDRQPLTDFQECSKYYAKEYKSICTQHSLFKNKAKTISELQFDTKTSQIELLPTWADYNSISKPSMQTPNCIFSLCRADKLKNPTLISVSPSALDLLELKQPESKEEQKDLEQHFSGNQKIQELTPYAHCYCGFQFGNFAGQLGDGRALELGEVLTQSGQRIELQLKGSGKTPYSRESDGRAVLRSSIREFLCSELMFFLGIPTTRAATLISSDTTVIRDPHYSGNHIHEKCCTVLRLAPDFIRFGSFEISRGSDPLTGRAGPSQGKHSLVAQLLDHVIQFHFSSENNEKQEKQEKENILSSDNDLQVRTNGFNIYAFGQVTEKMTPEEKYLTFYADLVQRTAKLVAHWQCVGFCHGVLNTDNMSILGLTIDYGPYGFIDSFNSNHICNTSDEEGRYSYANQPSICRWNLRKLAESLSPLISNDKLIRILDEYDNYFDEFYHSMMKKKLGFISGKSLSVKQKKFLIKFLETMELIGGDFTNSFRFLSQANISLEGENDLDQLNQDLIGKLVSQTASPLAQANTVKPAVPIQRLKALLSDPYQMSFLPKNAIPFIKAQAEKLKKWEQLKDVTIQEKQETDAKAWGEIIQAYLELVREDFQAQGDFPGDLEAYQRHRRNVMDSTNPKFILRNYLLQDAIAAAEKGDYGLLHKLTLLSHDPFGKNPDLDFTGYCEKPPDSSLDICVSCSS